jgi:hypothetical protein
MLYTTCGSDNPADAAFCEQCGGKCDRTADQQRWLMFLFDRGRPQAKDATQWIPFDQNPAGQNLLDIFKPTPAAENLMRLRGAAS